MLLSHSSIHPPGGQINLTPFRGKPSQNSELTQKLCRQQDSTEQRTEERMKEMKREGKLPRTERRREVRPGSPNSIVTLHMNIHIDVTMCRTSLHFIPPKYILCFIRHENLNLLRAERDYSCFNNLTMRVKTAVVSLRSQQI